MEDDYTIRDSSQPSRGSISNEFYRVKSSYYRSFERYERNVSFNRRDILTRNQYRYSGSSNQDFDYDDRNNYLRIRGRSNRYQDRRGYGFSDRGIRRETGRSDSHYYVGSCGCEICTGHDRYTDSSQQDPPRGIKSAKRPSYDSDSSRPSRGGFSYKESYRVKLNYNRRFERYERNVVCFNRRDFATRNQDRDSGSRNQDGGYDDRNNYLNVRGRSDRYQDRRGYGFSDRGMSRESGSKSDSPDNRGCFGPKKRSDNSQHTGSSQRDWSRDRRPAEQPSSDSESGGECSDSSYENNGDGGLRDPVLKEFLGTAFLKSLGIKGPLSNKVYISNLEFSIDAKRLKEVFALAGNVSNANLEVDDKGKSTGKATIEYKHYLEAVQAISMFDNQTLCSQMMSVSMKKFKENIISYIPSELPDGLKSLGKGLGMNGQPIRVHVPEGFVYKEHFHKKSPSSLTRSSHAMDESEPEIKEDPGSEPDQEIKVENVDHSKRYFE